MEIEAKDSYLVTLSHAEFACIRDVLGNMTADDARGFGVDPNTTGKMYTEMFAVMSDD